MPHAILNGDQAEFEREWLGKDPKLRPDWPVPSFDACDWAEAFCKQHPEVDVGSALGWFANALMRGYDEGRSASRHPTEPPRSEASPQ